MYGKDLEQLKAGILDLDCLSIELANDYATTANYFGAGKLEMDEDGQLQLTLYDTTQKLKLSTLSLNEGLGTWVPDSQFYNLTAIPMSGEAWTAADIHPYTHVHVARDGAVVRARLDSIETKSECKPQDSDWTWLYFAQRVRFPTNLFTSRSEQASDEDRPRTGSERNIWKIGDDEWDMRFRASEAGFSVEVLGPPLEGLGDCCKRIEESIWFTLGQPLAADIIKSRSEASCSSVIRSRGRTSKLSSAYPPYYDGFVDASEVLGEIFLSYFRFVLSEKRNRYHPLSVLVRKVLEAERRTLQETALALSIAIEGVVEIGFLDRGQPSKEFLALVAELEGALSRPLKNPVLKPRIRGFLAQLRRANSRNALHGLADEGAVSREQLDAWETLRHPGAHGKEYDLEYRELHHKVMHLRVLLNSLILSLIGYTGAYTDYASDGYPTLRYSQNRPTTARAVD